MRVHARADTVAGIRPDIPTRQTRIAPQENVNQTFFTLFPFSLRGKGEEKGTKEGGVRVQSHITPPTHPPCAHGTPPPFEQKGRYNYEKTHLFIGLAEGTLLERLTNIFTPAREEPGTEFGIVHEDNFSRRWLDDDHARRKEKVVRPETAFRDRRRRVLRVDPGSTHHGTVVVVGGCSGGCGPAL